MYWRRFCLLHVNARERAKGIEKWPSALSLPMNKSVRINRRLGLFDDPETNNMNIDSAATMSVTGLLPHNHEEEMSFVWPFDVARQVPVYDVMDWFDLTRPDQDYQHFAYASCLILLYLGVLISRRCLSKGGNSGHNHANPTTTAPTQDDAQTNNYNFKKLFKWTRSAGTPIFEW
jgi:hypothetical protein